MRIRKDSGAFGLGLRIPATYSITGGMKMNTRSLLMLDQFGRVGAIMTGVPEDVTIEDALTTQGIVYYEDLLEITDEDLSEVVREIPYDPEANEDLSGIGNEGITRSLWKVPYDPKANGTL